MTDSATVPSSEVESRPGKRERLVAAAVQLVYEQGIERTTLAEIAKAADVPPGNVYYYFKTKDEVVAAVVEAHAQQVKTTLASIESRHRTPKARLKALVRQFGAQGDAVAQFGCPLGSLCSELYKQEPGPAVAAEELMRIPMEWAQEQFRQLGRRDAHELALELLAAYEGSALLANTLRDPKVLTGAARHLDRWLDAL